MSILFHAFSILFSSSSMKQYYFSSSDNYNPSFETVLVFLIAFSCSVTITQSHDRTCFIKYFTTLGVAIDGAGNAFAVGSGNYVSSTGVETLSTNVVETVFYSSFSSSKFTKWIAITPPCKFPLQISVQYLGNLLSICVTESP